MNLFRILAVFVFPLLSCYIIYLFRKKRDKYLTFGFWWNSEGLPLYFIIIFVAMLVVGAIERLERGWFYEPPGREPTFLEDPANRPHEGEY